MEAGKETNAMHSDAHQFSSNIDRLCAGNMDRWNEGGEDYSPLMCFSFPRKVLSFVAEDTQQPLFVLPTVAKESCFVLVIVQRGIPCV
jgi:hypothetical protein